MDAVTNRHRERSVGAQSSAPQYTARLRYLHVAPRKVRLIADAVRGLSLTEAEAQLMHRTQRAAKPLLKLLRSAAANAKSARQAEREKLFIETLRVDQGPMLKRSLPRAQGRATPIHKKMSHVTLVLGERREAAPERFTIVPPVREKKLPKADRVRQPKPSQSAQAEKKPERKRGFLQRLFRRKSV